MRRMALVLTATLITLTSAAALARAQTVRGAVVEVRVTDRTGAMLDEAAVTMEGPSSRDAVTTETGVVTFENVTAGLYRIRIERRGFLPLEKETLVRSGARAALEAALSPAPAAATASLSAEPVAGPPLAELSPGDPALVSIPALAERMLGNPDPLVESVLGCSGATLSRLILLRDPLSEHLHASADETLYVVAGEASVVIGDRRQNAEPGWFGLVPRTTAHSVTRRGRNPVVLLSVISGDPCPGAVAVGR